MQRGWHFIFIRSKYKSTTLPRGFALLPVVVFVLTAAASAQTLPWGLGPKKGFVFQISNQEAQRLLVRSKPA